MAHWSDKGMKRASDGAPLRRVRETVEREALVWPDGERVVGRFDVLECGHSVQHSLDDLVGRFCARCIPTPDNHR